MPTAAGVPSGGTSNAVNILIGPPGNAPSMNITRAIPLESLRVEETGNHEAAMASFEFWDGALNVTNRALVRAMRGEWRVVISETIPGTQLTKQIFMGYMRQPSQAIKGIYGYPTVTCQDIGTLLDKLICWPPSGLRNANESDKARIQWLFNGSIGFNGTYGQQFVNDGGAQDWQYTQVLQASMPPQRFGNITLRQAVERVLSAGSDSANYYVDTNGRIHTFDTSNPEIAGWVAAPYDINVTPSPGAGQVAPEDLVVEWDTQTLVNMFYVRGKNSAGSGPFTDIGSINTYGLRQAYLDAPDATSANMASRVANAALKDTSNPIPRVSFTVEGSSCYNGQTRWRSGQLVGITSAYHGLTGQQFRIVRVTTTYMGGDGTRKMDIEAGSRRPHLYSVQG